MAALQCGPAISRIVTTLQTEFYTTFADTKEPNWLVLYLYISQFSVLLAKFPQGSMLPTLNYHHSFAHIESKNQSLKLILLYVSMIQSTVRESKSVAEL